MSLFKAREWWRAGGSGAGEGFSEGALAVGNCDNDPTGASARPAAPPPHRPPAARGTREGGPPRPGSRHSSSGTPRRSRPPGG